MDGAEGSQSPYTANPQPPEDIEEQDISSIRTSTNAVDSVSMSNHQSSNPSHDIAFDITLETSPQVGNGEPDPVEHLAQELAE